MIFDALVPTFDGDFSTAIALAGGSGRADPVDGA